MCISREFEARLNGCKVKAVTLLILIGQWSNHVQII